ncbi:MAG: 23S rRNA (adenine(2503)-C(2))-methyltransferase RlmN [Tissierellia bacterium]|nr:23S rRNA (adenine(2503)-C(2))-methyltransferase RlmN [Tissierellia bacterium]
MNILNLNFEELQDEIIKLGLEKYRASQIFESLHVKKKRSIDEIIGLSKDQKMILNEIFSFSKTKIEKNFTSKIDNTKKILLKLEDGYIIETVLMEYSYGNSICISTQVGCKMGCSFCRSGKDGLLRNLESFEMLDQVYLIENEFDINISNIVLMGSGEPLDNFNNVIKFYEIITDERGRNLSKRAVTLSTSGLASKIYDLADLELPLGLSISLHNCDNEKRSKLMPVNKSYPLEDLKKSLLYYQKKTGRRITFEYTLIKGQNDSVIDAENIIKFTKGLKCHINLIRLNPVDGFSGEKTNKDDLENFKENLKGLNVTIRRSLGSDISASCGELRAYYKKAKVMDLDISICSDKGLVREENEDSVLKDLDAKYPLFLLADGMGGYNGGKFASSKAIEISIEAIKNSLNNDGIDIKEILKSAIKEANAYIYKESINNSDLNGMGTTLIIACVYEGKLLIEHVGDSRVYLIRNGEINQITVDHSYVNELIKNGEITPEEAKTHPYRNKITRAVGTELTIESDSYEVDLVEGDMFIVSTDGLTKMITDRGLLNLFLKNENKCNFANELVEVANKEGGRDNISVITIAINEVVK